jgi:hypothetical protein
MATGEETVSYFGERWSAPVLDDARQVSTPVGQSCLLCAEPVVEGDRGFMRLAFGDGGASLQPVHRECEFRSVVGGLDHVEGRCRYVGHCGELREAAGRSVRQDALAVWEWAERRQCNWDVVRAAARTGWVLVRTTTKASR